MTNNFHMCSNCATEFSSKYALKQHRQLYCAAKPREYVPHQQRAIDHDAYRGNLRADRYQHFTEAKYKHPNAIARDSDGDY